VKRTLKRESKVLEIVNNEGIKTSDMMPLVINVIIYGM
jgi:hypothetical protein